MEVLTAYVREHARTPPKPQKDAQPSKGNPVPPEPTADIEAKPTADIEAILTVIGRRAHTYKNGEEQRLNLAHTDLRDAALHRARLQGANLIGAQLQWTILHRAQLQGAMLIYAELQGAYLEGAQLQGVHYVTVEQLCAVRTLYQAQLDQPLLEQIQQRCPWLLKEPKK